MMTEDASDLILRLHREEIDRLRSEPPPTRSERPDDHASLLPDAAPDSPVVQEWDLYRREVGRLLREGHMGRFALVKLGHAITVWDTLRDAVQAARALHGEGPALVQEILPFVRPLRVGYSRRCLA